MSDKTEQILVMAIQAAGSSDDGQLAWRKRVITAIGDIAGMWNEHSIEWAAASLLAKEKDQGGCHVFYAEYRGHRIEGSSTRLLIDFWDDREEKMQTLRSDRTDEILGAVMKDRIERIAPGTRCRCWRFQEQISRDKSVNVLKMIEPASAREDAAPAQSAAGSTPPPSAGSGGGSGSPSSLPPPTDTPAAAPTSSRVRPPSFDAAMGRLSAAQKVRLAQAAAKEHKIFNVYEPKEDDIDTLLSMMETMFPP